MSRMTRREYDAENARLTAQRDAAVNIVNAYEAGWHASGNPVEEAYGDAWNAAHDAVTALEAALRQHESAWTVRDVPQATLDLVAANID